MSGRELMVGGKPLSALRVVDLKEELDKRGLSKSGSKKDLAERLKVHLQIEKHREGASRDEEQLPNISMQEKLAEQNPFIRDYFASQAELYHSQKVVKKLYEEETRKESEASGASADEGCDSPVKEKKIVSSSERSKVRKLVQQFETQSKDKDDELQRSSKISKNDEVVKPQEVISEEASKVDVGHSERRLTRGRSTEGLRSRESRRVSGDKSPAKDSKLSSTKTIVNDSKQLSKDMKLCEVETVSVDIPTGKDILVPKEKLGDDEMKEHENVSNVVLDLSVGDGSKEIPKSSILTRQSRSSEKSLVKDSVVLQPETQESPKKMVGKIEVTKEPVKTPKVTITENPQNLDLSFTKGEEKDSVNKSPPVKVVANEISSKSNAKQETQASISQPAQLDISPPKKQIREIVYATKSVVRPVEPEKYETRKTDNQVAPKSVNVALIQPIQHNSPDKEVKLAKQKSPDKAASAVKHHEEKDENDKTELEIHANVTEIDIDLNISSKETKLPDPDTRLTGANAAEATQSQSVIKTRETSDKSPAKDRKLSKVTVTKESLENMQAEDKKLGSVESSKKQLDVIDANPTAVKLNMEGLRSEENVKLGKTDHSIVHPAAKEQVKSSEIKPGHKSSEKSPEKEVKLPTEIDPVNKSSLPPKKSINRGSEDVENIQKDPKQDSKDVQNLEKSSGKGDLDFSKGEKQPHGKGEKESTSYKEKESPSSKGKESPSRKEKESHSRTEIESHSRKEKESHSRKEKESPSHKERESPSRREKESPSRREKESPSRREKESLSRREKESPSRREKESLSRREKESPSRKEKESTSRKEKESTSRKEKEATPQKDKEATLQKEKEATLQKEKEATLQKEKEVTLQKEKEATLQKEKEATLQKEKEATLQKEKEATLQKEKEATLQKEKEATLQKEKEATLQKEKEATLQKEKEATLQKEKVGTPQKEKEATSQKEKESPSQKAATSHKEKESASHKQKELISYKEKTPTREGKEAISQQEKTATRVEKEIISHKEKTTAREDKEASERKISTHTKSPIVVKRKHSTTIEEPVLRIDDKDENDKAELELHVNTAEIIDVEEPSVTIRSSRISTNKMEINNSSSKLAERSRRFQLSRDKFQPQKKQKRSDSSSSSESRSPSMVTTTRQVSVRTEEMDDEALDYGDEEKSKSEPEKFNWSGRILRLKNKQMIRSKERKWRKDTTRKTVVFMDNEYYQTLYADVKPVAVNELKLDDKSPPRVERKIEIIRKISLDTEEKEFIPTPAIVEDKPITRKVSIVPIVDDNEKELTPSRNPPSQFIIVTNLVRPFTLPQLKDLLQRTGNIVDIWVDKIKSTCIAKFETEEEALETRSALHGVQWPATNSKPLHVDYSTEESFEDYKAKDAGEAKPNVEKPKLAQTHPVREWDLGKRSRSRSPSRIRRRSRSTSRDRKRVRPSHSPHRRRHSRTPTQDRKGRGADVKDAEPTGKALDELFRKTAATPSIYWLPLTPQQIAEKEDLRRRRMQERERRLAELSKLRPR